MQPNVRRWIWEHWSGQGIQGHVRPKQEKFAKVRPQRFYSGTRPTSCDTPTIPAKPSLHVSAMTTLSFSAAPVVAVVRRLATLFTLPAVSATYTPKLADAWTLNPWARRRISNSPERVQNQPEAFATPPPVEPEQKPKKEPRKRDLKELYGHSDDTLHKLLINPALYDPLRRPRFPVVLCHGTLHRVARFHQALMVGQVFTALMFAVHPPSQCSKCTIGTTFCISCVNASAPRSLSRLSHRTSYLSYCEEHTTDALHRTGSITSRAEDLDRALRDKAQGRAINFLAHSMGGLDCRHLISNIKPTEYTPLSLTTVSTPHHGSPFMDWCTVR